MMIFVLTLFTMGQMNPISAKENKQIITDGTYQIVNLNKNQVLNQDTGLINSTNATESKWKITNDENGYITIENLLTKEVLTSSKKQVKTESNKGLQSQKWKIKQTENGYEILSVKKEGYSLVNEEVTSLKKKESQEWSFKQASTWTGAVLSPSAGAIQGPSGKETYYNLDMSGVVANMKAAGYQGEYWVREDGAKMFGDYVMVAAELSSRPKGTILETSLGMAMVCDTGGFASSNPTQIDIATNW